MPASINILVVDDDPVQRRLLRGAVERAGYGCTAAEDGAHALALLERGGTRFGAVVLDLVMPKMDGLSVMAAMAERGMRIPVVVQTGQGGIDTVVKAMRAGAFDFVVKPVSPERLAASIDNALKVDERQEGPQRGGRRAARSTGFRDILSASPAMERVLRLAKRAAASDIPVVIEGESGVGKEMIARAIQNASDRRGKPFVTVNCGAIPENLVESILFGHEKGAFTGATERHTGKFVEADGGTLFLDEIGELPLDVQVKLLRAVQHGEIETVGARSLTKVDIRLISATNKDLIEEVKEGRFREDLYYRLNVFPILVPALRRRKEDIPLLVRYFAERFAAEQGFDEPVTVAPDAMALLTAYDWPGNIRQLENAVFRAVVLSDGAVLTPDVFPQIAAQLPDYEVAEVQRGGAARVSLRSARAAGEARAGSPASFGRGGGDRALPSRPGADRPRSGPTNPDPTNLDPTNADPTGADPSGAAGSRPHGAGGAKGWPSAEETAPGAQRLDLGEATPALDAGPSHSLSADLLEAWSSAQAADGPETIAGLDARGEVRTLAAVEEDLIRFALKFYGGQMSLVARRLGIGRSTLYRKLKDYAIDPEDPLRTTA